MAKRVLFLCTGNSARSQMAEAFMRKLAGDKYEAFSAGMEPKGLHPMTVEVMQEVGIDVSGQRSKGIKEIMGRFTFDDAIIVCRKAEDDCPKLSADARRIHRWIFEDPVRIEGTDEEKLTKFREVRDQIEARIKLWLDETAEAERVG
ncbi:MAG: arsenate reductase ArsC [Chloroflexota bacterium]|nr:arsenate reductase ArsC [Chloroflexota bacterium]